MRYFINIHFGYNKNYHYYNASYYNFYLKYFNIFKYGKNIYFKYNTSKYYCHDTKQICKLSHSFLFFSKLIVRYYY